MRIRPIALCLGLAATAGLALPAHAQYDVTLLQDVGGRGHSLASAINDAGQSIGFSQTVRGADAVLWAPSGIGTVLQDVGGLGSSGVDAINDAGQSVGGSVTSCVPRHFGDCSVDAVLWSRSGKATVLQDVGGQGDSEAFAINNAGLSVGNSTTASGVDAVLWSPTGKATVLQDVGGRGSEVNAINDAGQSVGSSSSGRFPGAEAVLWSRSGKAAVLQDAGGQDNSSAVAINDGGQSVGDSINASGGFDAVLWSRSGKATLLRNVGSDSNSIPNAINDAGWGVGYSFTSPTFREAALWSPTGKATDLGAVLGPSWSDTEAVGINNSGDIIGSGEYHGGTFAFLLTPDSATGIPAASAPEPSTWAMLLAGFAGLGFAGCRRAKTSHAAAGIACFTRASR